jgi:hypothetical protein
MGINMIVKLTELDTYEIAWAAHERWAYKRDLGYVSSKRIDQKRDDYAITREGMAGEWAVAKVLGVPVNLDLHPGGDPGWDFDYCGVKIDVKTSRAKYLLFNTLNSFKADFAVFAKYLNDYQVELVGMVSRQDFKQKCEIRDFGYGEKYVMHPDQLIEVRQYL